MPRSVLTLTSFGEIFRASPYHLIASSYCSASKYRLPSSTRGAAFEVSRAATVLSAVTCVWSSTAARLVPEPAPPGWAAAAWGAAAGPRATPCCDPMIQPAIRPNRMPAIPKATASVFMASQTRHHGGH
jgi:hypothetical protein